MDKIRLLIVDDSEDMRRSVRQMLTLDATFEVVGEASDGAEALEKVRRLRPDVVLMDINMPNKNGIEATKELTLEFPTLPIIILSVQAEGDYLRKAMAAGARDYLVKPFTPDDLYGAVRGAVEFVQARAEKLKVEGGEVASCHAVMVVGAKGGVGKSVLCVNLAAVISRLTGQKVLLLDLDLQFGDVAMLLNRAIKHHLAEAAGSEEVFDAEALDGLILREEGSDLDCLAAPPNPVLAETISPRLVSKVLDLGRLLYRYILIDTPAGFQEASLTALDLCDKVVVVTGLDLPTVKNTKLCLDTLRSLQLSEEKITLVLNRASSQTGLKVEDVEQALAKKIAHKIPSDGNLVMPSVNKGKPFVLDNREAEVSRAVFSLARDLAGLTDEGGEEGTAAVKKAGKGLFRRFR